MRLPLDDIVIDPEVQSRDHLDATTVERYTEMLLYFIHAARTKDNKHNREGYVETLTDAYGELYAEQELQGDIISAEGRIYPN